MTIDMEKPARAGNMFAQAAIVAWGNAVLMGAAMVWPGFDSLFIRKRHPIIVGWPILLATLVLAIMLSAPRLIPRQRVMACKLFSAGLMFVSFFFVGGGVAFGLGFLTGKIFYEAGKK
jgi:hypothetical protein